MMPVSPTGRSETFKPQIVSESDLQEKTSVAAQSALGKRRLSDGIPAKPFNATPIDNDPTQTDEPRPMEIYPNQLDDPNTRSSFEAPRGSIEQVVTPDPESDEGPFGQLEAPPLAKAATPPSQVKAPPPKRVKISELSPEIIPSGPSQALSYCDTLKREIIQIKDLYRAGQRSEAMRLARERVRFQLPVPYDAAFAAIYARLLAKENYRKNKDEIDSLLERAPVTSAIGKEVRTSLARTTGDLRFKKEVEAAQKEEDITEAIQCLETYRISAKQGAIRTELLQGYFRAAHLDVDEQGQFLYKEAKTFFEEKNPFFANRLLSLISKDEINSPILLININKLQEKILKAARGKP